MGSKFDEYLKNTSLEDKAKIDEAAKEAQQAVQQAQHIGKDGDQAHQPKLDENTAERIENIQGTDAGNNYLTQKDNLAQYQQREEAAQEAEAGKEQEQETER